MLIVLLLLLLQPLLLLQRQPLKSKTNKSHPAAAATATATVHVGGRHSILFRRRCIYLFAVFLPLFCCCCCRCCFLAAYCLAFGLCWLLFVCFWPINGLCHIPLPPCITALPPSAMHLPHASLLLSAFNGAFKVTFVFPSPALAWVRLRILFYARLSRSFTQRFFLASKLLPSCLLRKL